jgi:hypothetical protein
MAIIYDDGMYLRVKEFYRQLSRGDGGGGCLDSFAYHYGPCSGAFDPYGFPTMIPAVELRIDMDLASGRHAHYRKPGEHIPEQRLPGLNFDLIDPFIFIRAVEIHRQNTTKTLPEILNFQVVGQA